MEHAAEAIKANSTTLAAAALDAASGRPVHLTLAGYAVVLVGEEHFRRLDKHRGTGRNRAVPCWAPTMQELAAVIGAEAADELAYARRYSPRASIPAEAEAGHWLVRAIGQDAAGKLCLHMRVGGNTKRATLILPDFSGRTGFYVEARKKALEMTSRDLSISTIARALGVSTRSVEKWREKAKRERAGAPRHTAERPPVQRGRIENDV